MGDKKPSLTSNDEVNSKHMPSPVDTTSYRGPRLLCSDSSSQRRMNSLAKDDLIVVFTPAVRSPGTGSDIKPDPDAGEPEDPFEPFGRAIGQRHGLTRQVPFIPNLGLTDLHLVWIRRAEAFIVVVCEPQTLPGGNKHPDCGFSVQEEFMCEVVKALREMRGNAETIPASALICGLSSARRHPLYHNILLCRSYRPSDLESAAILLMGQ
ncbi:hypothetical protein MBLNU459_g1698t1 [Dothideomycetes sp. NU459]